MQKRYFPIVAKKFARIPNMKIWEIQTFDFIESIARRIEEKYGRLKPYVIKGEGKFNETRMSILKDIEAGQHFR